MNIMLKTTLCILLMSYFHVVISCKNRDIVTQQPPRGGDLSKCRFENFQTSRNDLTSKNFTSGSNLFSANFYQVLAEKEVSNFVSSPISALFVLAMAAYGAAGTTKQELRNALQLPIDEESILLNFRDYIANLKNITDVELHLANKFYIQNELPINHCFKQIITDAFQSEIESINFQDSVESAKKINTWCRNKTKDKITDIIKADDLGDAELVMINAVYFKGEWDRPFDNEMQYRDFFLSETESVSIQMMCRTGFRYSYDKIARYIELPYKSEDSKNGFSMIIIYPMDDGGLDRIVDNFSKIDFAHLYFLQSYEDICMPKFAITTELDLIPTLKDMNIKDMFTNSADFSNLSQVNLKISKVFQKAFLSVDEKGSTATAATVGGAEALSLDDSTNVVDRPFIAGIIAKGSGTPLFLARVNDPRL